MQRRSPIRQIRGAAASALILWVNAAVAGESARVVSFRADLQPILNSRCVVCHVTGAENAGLNLARSVARRNLVGVPSTESKLMRVAPGKPEDSYLMHKLLGSQGSVGGSGTLMPQSDSLQPLESSQLELFRSWILGGAPDN